MNIINTSHENMSKVDVYRLTKSPAVMKMSNVPDDEEITVSKWCTYEEADAKNPETINTILAIADDVTGCCYATNSETFRRSFGEITDIFGNDGFTISVMHGVSKNDRDFITAVFCKEV